MSEDLNIMGTENQLGIELIEKFIKESIELGFTIEKQLKDGWQWTDLWSIIGEAKDLRFVISEWGEIKNQFQDLTEDEIVSIVKKTVGDLGISDEEILSLIDNIIEFAQASYQLVLSFKNLKK